MGEAKLSGYTNPDHINKYVISEFSDIYKRDVYSTLQIRYVSAFIAIHSDKVLFDAIKCLVLNLILIHSFTYSSVQNYSIATLCQAQIRCWK